MASDRIQISGLEEKSSANDSDYLVIHRTNTPYGNLDYKITVANFNSTSTSSAASYAQAAANSATAAANSASQAATTANNVNSALTTASGLVANASGYADRAETAASQAELLENSTRQMNWEVADLTTTCQQKAGQAANSESNALLYKNAAEAAAALAYQYAGEGSNNSRGSEAWARGTRDNEPVGSSDPTYHNNSKYYSEQASSYSQEAESHAQDAEGYSQTAGAYEESARNIVNNATNNMNVVIANAERDLGIEISNAVTSINAATSRATAAASNAEGFAANSSLSASSSADSAEDSEAWAVGQRDGVDVPSTDDTYENNSKYYAGQSQTAAAATSGALEAAQEIIDDLATLLSVPQFSVDFNTGDLIYTMDNVYTFSINNTTGDLEWEVSA